MNKERNYQPVLVVLVLIVIGVAAWNLFTIPLLPMSLS